MSDQIEDDTEIWQLDVDGLCSLYDDYPEALRVFRAALADGIEAELTVLLIPRAWLFEGRWLYDHTRYRSASEALEALRASRDG